jgi:hypothetical protein
MKKTNNIKSKLEFHSVANIMPMMSNNEYEALKLDVKANGLREPIVIYQNKIIDGRNRYNACLDTGIKPIFKEYKGEEKDLIDFVISLNINRRHLTKSQLSCLAVENLPYYETKAKELKALKQSNLRKGKSVLNDNIESINSVKLVSELFGVANGYISEAKRLHKENIELFELVKSGELTLKNAIKQLSFLKSEKISNNDNISNSPQTLTNNELTKNDLKKINELVNELGITETKAKDYILKKKSNVKPKLKSNIEYKEVKFRLSEIDKTKLSNKAKLSNRSVSDLLRELISKLK